LTKTLLRLVPLILASTIPCFSQTPAWEFFAGYSLERAGVHEYYKSTPIIYTFRDSYLNLNGWEASVTENVNRWVGGTLQATGNYKTPVVQGITNRERMFSIVYGPRITYRTSWVTPYGHILLGIAHASVAVTPTGPHISETIFAAAAGGGVDVNLGRKVAVRVLQVQYSPMNPVGTKSDRFQGSAGIVFFVGGKK